MIDEEVRSHAFLWLREQAERHDFVIPRTVLEHGFPFGGRQIHLMGAKGIWKPAVCELPISVTSTVRGPYEDGFTDDGLLVYRYQGTNPDHSDNVGLRRLVQSRTPFIYFHSVIRGKYVPVWPVFGVRDLPGQLAIHAAVEPAYASGFVQADWSAPEPEFSGDSAVGVRRYVAAFTRRRLHQSAFRERVIDAYRHTCVLCRLQHQNLLDAAHIIPDSRAGGDPIVPNGLCLCKIHHAAYDQNILGVSPDYSVHVRADILRETDGPMLRHGLQELDGSRIVLPARKAHYPDPERLEVRFREFRDAS